MHKMNKTPRRIAKGTEQLPTDPNKLLEQKWIDDKTKSIIVPALRFKVISYRYGKFIQSNLGKSEKKIVWSKNNLFSFKIVDKVTMSSHISNLQSLINQPTR